jgi:hypothetical protein
MPRSASALALLGPLLLTSCSGLGVFLDDTHDPTLHPNRPIGNSETIRRVEDKQVAIEALKAEPGNVWPGPVPPEPTLEDLQKMPPKPLPDLTGSTPPTLSNRPALVIPAIPHHLQPRPGDDEGVLTGPLPGAGPPPAAGAGGPLPQGASPQGVITPTPKGNAVSTRNPSGIGQVNPSDKQNGIVVPNGDGTSTVIAPNGAISTIPTPK